MVEKTESLFLVHVHIDVFITKELQNETVISISIISFTFIFSIERTMDISEN
jgi:hypothetical protein